MDGLDGAARHESDAAAGGGLSAEPDHLPRRLWWVLAALTLAWGFNWTAMKVALSEVPPWTFRSLCLGLGSAVLFARAARRRPAPRVSHAASGRRLWLLALLQHHLLEHAGGLRRRHDPVGPRGDPRLHHAGLGGAALGAGCWASASRGASCSAWRSGIGGLALLLGESFVSLGARAARLAAGARRRACPGRSAPCCRSAIRSALPVGAYTAWIMLLGGVPIFIGALAVRGFARRSADVGLMARARHGLQRAHRLRLRALGLDQDRHLGAGERVLASACC